MRFATQYTKTVDRYRPSTDNNEPDLTQQSDKDDCDINIIMERYAATGYLPSVAKAALYGDFSNITDFRGAQEQIIAARDAFNELPAQLREKFGNDPAAFLDFVSNPDNLEEMRELGLANPSPETHAPPQVDASAPSAQANSTTTGENNNGNTRQQQTAGAPGSPPVNANAGSRPSSGAGGSVVR